MKQEAMTTCAVPASAALAATVRHPPIPRKLRPPKALQDEPATDQPPKALQDKPATDQPPRAVQDKPAAAPKAQQPQPVQASTKRDHADMSDPWLVVIQLL